MGLREERLPPLHLRSLFFLCVSVTLWRRYQSPTGFSSCAWAAASRAIGTRYGEHDT
jgi:hypothetical protein